MPGRIRSGYFRLSIWLSVFIGMLAISPRLSAQVTSAPNYEIFSAPGTQVFTVSVSSGTTLGSYSVLTLGAPNLDFTSVPGGTTCPNVTAGTCTVEVQFQPLAPGRRQGAVVFSDPSGNILQTVSLDGTGTGPVGAFEPGIISTFAGNGTGGDGGPASSALLAGPTGIARDGFGNHYIADRKGNKVRKVTPSGVISTVAGTGIAGYSGDGGAATSAQLSGPMAVLVDGAGLVYIADTGNNVIRMVDNKGIISTYAGQYYAPGTTPPAVCAGATNSVGDGCPGNQIVLNTPVDLVFCVHQNLHIADKLNNRVRTILRVTYNTITQVGNGVAGYDGDSGLSTGVELNGPTSMDMDAANYIYVADSGNHIIRKAFLSGTTPEPISTVAGIPGSAGDLGDGGSATSAELDNPTGVKVDAAGDIYISDSASQVVREVNAANGQISTVVGTATAGYTGDGGSAVHAQLSAPSGLLLDENGNLYIADTQNSVVRKVDISDAPSLTFPNTPVGVTSPSQDVSVTNLGNAPFTIGKITTSTNFSLGGSETTCNLSSGQTLSAATSCVLGIEFTPPTTGPFSGSIVISDSLNPASQTIALTGTGILPTQTITFPNPGTQTYGVGPITLTASASSSLPVSYAVISGPATLNGNTLTITGAGTVTVEATQPGNANYTAATPVSLTFTVNPETEAYSVAVKNPTLSMTAGTNGTTALTLNSSNYAGTVSFVTTVTSTNGTPADLTVTATPVTLASGGTGTSTVAIAANASAANQTPEVPWNGGAAVFCAALFGAPFISRRKRALGLLSLVLVIALVGCMVACGAVGSSSVPHGARTYTVTATPTGSASPAGSVVVTNPAPVSIMVAVQ